MPTLSVPVLSETKVLVDALSTLLQASPGRVIDLITSAYVGALGDSEKDAIDRLKQAALSRLNQNASSSTRADSPVAEYEFSRLCFKRDIIEALAPGDAFRVLTPTGVFQMTKAQFHRAFPNVVQSRSYVENGIYHYPKLPARAEEFRIK